MDFDYSVLIDTGFRKFLWTSWISWISTVRPTAINLQQKRNFHELAATRAHFRLSIRLANEQVGPNKFLNV